MKRIKLLFLLFSVLVYQNTIAQNFSSEERRKETENILNTVINSSPFDSVYKYKRVYFLANELITENTTLVLKRAKCKAKILNENKVKKVKQYVVLGDFTLDWNNPVVVRVQIQIMPKNTLLNISLVKKSGKWIIKNYVIFKED